MRWRTAVAHSVMSPVLCERVLADEQRNARDGRCASWRVGLVKRKRGSPAPGRVVHAPRKSRYEPGSQRQPSLLRHTIDSPSPAMPVLPWSLLRQNSPGS